jgi:hypothetical protein
VVAASGHACVAFAFAFAFAPLPALPLVLRQHSTVGIVELFTLYIYLREAYPHR